MKRAGLIAILFLVLIVWLIDNKPYGESKRGGFTEILHAWGNEQSDMSDEITTEVVGDMEGKYVPKHKDDGSNWSIPNIVRHILGVSRDD